MVIFNDADGAVSHLSGFRVALYVLQPSSACASLNARSLLNAWSLFPPFPVPKRTPKTTDILLQREFLTTWTGKLSYVHMEWRSVFVQHLDSIIHGVCWACPNLPSKHQTPQECSSTTVPRKPEHDDDGASVLHRAAGFDYD